MQQRRYGLPDEFPETSDRFVNLANEMGANVSRQAAAYFRGEYETMFRENVKEIEPVYQAASAAKGAEQ